MGIDLKTYTELFLKYKFDDIIGQDEIKMQLKSALISGRHIIVVGPPGIGKTTLAKSIAKALPKQIVNDCEYHCSPNKPICPQCRDAKVKPKTKTITGEEAFVRIQGSPDLTAEDLIGDIDPIKALKYGALSLEAFTPGKIFKANNGVLFFDEVNRCPEKLQNALLQVLQERKVTIGSYNFDFEADFIFIGTMNPEDQTTETLSDVFLDRVDLVYMDYPKTQEIEETIVKKYGKTFINMPDKLFVGMIQFVRLLRQDDNVSKKPSVRASLGLYERSQANALIRGQKKVSYKDLFDAMTSVLAHRIKLKSSIKYLKSPGDYLAEKFQKYSQNTGLSESEGDLP